MINLTIKLAIPIINAFLAKGLPFPQDIMGMITLKSATFDSYDNFVRITCVPVA
jgi:hypothetical protein